MKARAPGYLTTPRPVNIGGDLIRPKEPTVGDSAVTTINEDPFETELCFSPFVLWSTF